MDINTLPCTACKAPANEGCVTPSGNPAKEPHKARVDAYWASKRTEIKPAAKVVNDHKRPLVEAVKAYAAEHYEEGGWDIVVETWSDEDIAYEIRYRRTVAGAIRQVAHKVGIVNDVRADIQSA